ncbi:hypothetical protein ACIBO2_15415 [Nonomuraea sp. NPDC050022]|uniref:hypothetical protein n=1 Tax=unclassified Nonomuraea TaxID=2593643 RepID=UPI0033E05A8E
MRVNWSLRHSTLAQLFYVVQGEERFGEAVYGPAALAGFPEDIDLNAFKRVASVCRVLDGGHVEIFYAEVPIPGIDVDHDGVSSGRPVR